MNKIHANYPVDCIPEFAQPIVRELAKTLNCSLSLPATLALGVMSGAAGKMARLYNMFPRLWAVAKAPDAPEYDHCLRDLFDLLREGTESILDEGEFLFYDSYEDYQGMMNMSIDGSVLIQVGYSANLMMSGATDDSMPCVGRLVGEVWLQPSIWKEVLCADCLMGRSPFHPEPISEGARKSWKEGLTKVVQQRIDTVRRPRVYKDFESDDLPDDADSIFFKLLLLISIFSGEVGLKDKITAQDVARAKALFAWHQKAKKRLWKDGQKGGWEGASFYRTEDSTSDVWQEVEAARKAKMNQVIEGGIKSNLQDGDYLFVPDPHGIPCGSTRFLQASGPKLRNAQIRRAICDIEDLLSDANREVHWDFGIWRRNEFNGIAAAVRDRHWVAGMPWKMEPEKFDGDDRVWSVILNMWVAKTKRKQGVATALVKAIADHTKKPCYFSGPYTEGGLQVAKNWYKTHGGPDGWGKIEATVHPKNGASN
jgi:GNAT superfamily N-acetyltransferase